MKAPTWCGRQSTWGSTSTYAVHETFFETVPSYQGGTFSNFAQWIPGRIVSESLDPFHMTSVAYFERWGREPAERMLETFDGGVLHIHGNGRHLLEAAATMKGLKTILLLDDRGFPLAFDVLSGIAAQGRQRPACGLRRLSRVL